MKRFILGVAAALGFTTGQAAADGLPSHGRTAAPEAEVRPCSVSGEAGFSSQTVIRGISESNENFSVQGGVTLTCGRFYVGAAGTSVDALGASALVDLAVGFKPKTGPVTWDLGVIYHAYNDNDGDLNYTELKVAASAEVWRGGVLGGSVIYAPEYGGLTGVALGANDSDTWTIEGNFAQTLPAVGIFTPTVSAAVGQVNFDDAIIDEYVYWNAGVTLSFLEKWSVDLRYSDSDIKVFNALGGLADERFIATLKYSF